MASDLYGTKANGADKSHNQGAKNGSGYLKSLVEKRSLVIGGHKTSVSLEEPFWNALRAIARERNLTLSRLVAGIDSEREHGNLSSAIRLFILDHSRKHQ